MKRGEAPGDGPCLLTGATGFLGSHIMAELLARGRRLVIAGRPAGGESLRERVLRLLAWFGCGQRLGQLEFLETDFLKPGLGLKAGEYERLCRRGLPIVHCASDTRFAEKNREAVMAANVAGLGGILELARRSRARYFHLLSSAYAAGIDFSDCREAPVRSLRFNNPYEESKALAETAVSDTCRANGIPFTIIRPAIVYGDARTGRSLRFNALYHPVRSLLQLRDIYLADIRKNRGIRSAASGICLEDGGVLHLPIRIIIPQEGKINLVPVDYFTTAALAILDQPESGVIYHLTSRQPTSMTRLAEFTERFLGLSGIEVLIGAASAAEMRNPAEEIFDLFIRPYRPYIADSREFSRENADRATRGAQPPDFDYAVFRRCMEFAVAADWGKKLF